MKMALQVLSPRGGYSLKRRLYALIGFLALLPLFGVVITSISQQRMARDDVVLDHAASGTIHLTRINGLVYASTMESRGIYMSADWKAAEKFAGNLIADLDELRQELPAWQADATALRESNIGELTRRIEDFIRFRTELVRLAKEESTAAARAFGDNEANRDVRSALNHSLDALAIAYQQETERARATVEAGDRAFIAAIAVLAGVAGIAVCVGFLLVHRSLLRPLLWLRLRMLKLAAGDLGITIDDQPQRAIEIADMAQAAEIFRCNLIDRERLSHETGLLASLDEWLQSANSLGELYDMVGSFLNKLLPGCSGTLYIYANSRDVLESAKGWNGATAAATIHPDDCWALRRGRTYTFGANSLDFPCAHVSAAAPEPYCCVPILAYGETMGLLHLKFRAAGRSTVAGSNDAETAAQRRLAIICTEHISLAIANVKLRDQLRDQSIRDPLTGLFNRRYLMETCRREFARAARTNQDVGVLSLDIDHFKKYNDNHGHDAGDTVLRAVGGCLDTQFRADDVPCRFGGEEFVVILPGADLAAAARRAEQLRSQIEALIVRYLDRDLPRITVSIGVATFPQAGDSPSTVFRVADEALYRAKAAGRNRVETATSLDDDSLPTTSLAVEGQPPLATLVAAADG
jgi:diguanylate cyclase (GGDEF)-like protein